MVLTATSLTVHPGAQLAFEAAFLKAERLIAGVDGYLNHELRRSLDSEQQYLLLIEWRSLEDDTLGFRKSMEFLRWRDLLQEHLALPPQILHFGPVVRATAPGR